jgi:hypothetical protein
MVIPNYTDLKHQAHSYEEKNLSIIAAASRALELRTIWATVTEVAPKSSMRKQSMGAFKPTEDTKAA